MGRQVNFYFSDQDIAEFGRLIVERWDDLLIFPFRSDKRFAIEDSERELESSKESKKFLTRKTFFDRIQMTMHDVKGLGEKYFIDEFSSPVIEFWRPLIRGNSLVKGRVYFIAECYDDNHEKVIKDKEFIKWGDAVLRLARKYCTRHEDWYIGPHALRLVREEKYELRLN